MGIYVIWNICCYVRCVVVIIFGRFLVIELYLFMMDVFVVVWLFGMEVGFGIVDVFFGVYDFIGKFLRMWF